MINDLDEVLIGILVILSIFTHIYAIMVIRKYSILGSWARMRSKEIDDMIIILKEDIERWRAQVNGYLEISPGEHLYHAIITTLASIGAKDLSGLSKEQIGRINMARSGVNSIAQSITGGLSGNAGSGKPTGSPGGGLSNLLGMFGGGGLSGLANDLGPLIQLVQGVSGGAGEKKPQKAKKDSTEKAFI